MLGRDAVIAPVMKESTTSRRLYLPAGRWIEDYPASLDTLPLFVREGTKAASIK